MKCVIPEISWHNRDPVLSVDVHPNRNGNYKLATGGSDTFVLIWQLRVELGDVQVEILAELNKHQRAVNSVKWSPSGHLLASGDDDANIILWQLKTDNVPLLDGETGDKETYNVFKIFRGHKEDVYDLCWSPDGSKLLSGSVDNSAILWNVAKGKCEQIITDHKSFVQGVAWDPKNQYLATLSSDRICRVFTENGKRIKARIGRGVLPVQEGHALFNKEVKYFHDDTFKTFFRRLNFSPDGSLLVVPSGCVETEDNKSAMYGTYIFTLDMLQRPSAILPTLKQSTIVAKCCPILYDLRPSGAKPIIDLPYRMIIAVATDSDVILYDTQQLAPFAHLQKIHYTRLTDLSWSNDGLLLVVSSTDGFISFVNFEIDEIGTEYVKEETAVAYDLNISGCEELPKEDEKKSEDKKIEEKPKKPSFLEQWAKNAPKRKIDEISHEKEPKKLKSDEINRLIPKRITPMRVDDKNEEVNKKIKRITPISIKENDEIKKLDDNIKKRITPTRVTKDKKEDKLIEKNKNDFNGEVIEVADSPVKIQPESKRSAEKTKRNLSKSAKKDETVQRSAKKKAAAAAAAQQQTPNSKMSLLKFFKKVTPPKFEDDDADNARDGTESKKSSPECIDLCEDSFPADLTLQLEESVDCKPEKENKITAACEIKQHRRVPLITLASPKNKKKKPNV